MTRPRYDAALYIDGACTDAEVRRLRRAAETFTRRGRPELAAQARDKANERHGKLYRARRAKR